MPKETKGETRELRFRIGVEFVDFLEHVAKTNLFGNSVGEVARRIIQDHFMEYVQKRDEFEAEHRKLKSSGE
jgi:hypothetical protein